MHRNFTIPEMYQQLQKTGHINRHFQTNHNRFKTMAALSLQKKPIFIPKKTTRRIPSCPSTQPEKIKNQPISLLYQNKHLSSIGKRQFTFQTVPSYIDDPFKYNPKISSTKDREAQTVFNKSENTNIFEGEMSSKLDIPPVGNYMVSHKLTDSRCRSFSFGPAKKTQIKPSKKAKQNIAPKKHSSFMGSKLQFQGVKRQKFHSSTANFCLPIKKEKALNRTDHRKYNHIANWKNQKNILKIQWKGTMPRIYN